MSLASPSERNWWDLPVAVHEKVWLIVAVATGLVLFLMMPFWHVVGRQNSSATSYRVAAQTWYTKVNDWVKTAKVGSKGVEPPGTDVYLSAMRYQFYPNSVVLKTGVEYRFHVSSPDVNHGFSVHKDGATAQKVNFQVVPGYDYVITMEFSEPGVYTIVCTEYCGLGHHEMKEGKIIVEGGR
ncbi:MAG: cytochrome C oxidase subunit II [Chloroflexi bacterium]|nr:cytochrome C oxidase subunit II [Chloroflexota bacterium]